MSQVTDTARQPFPTSYEALCCVIPLSHFYVTKPNTPVRPCRPQPLRRRPAPSEPAPRSAKAMSSKQAPPSKPTPAAKPQQERPCRKRKQCLYCFQMIEAARKKKATRRLSLSPLPCRKMLFESCVNKLPIYDYRYYSSAMSRIPGYEPALKFIWVLLCKMFLHSRINQVSAAGNKTENVSNTCSSSDANVTETGPGCSKVNGSVPAREKTSPTVCNVDQWVRVIGSLKNSDVKEICNMAGEKIIMCHFVRHAANLDVLFKFGSNTYDSFIVRGVDSSALMDPVTFSLPLMCFVNKTFKSTDDPSNGNKIHINCLLNLIQKPNTHLVTVKTSNKSVHIKVVELSDANNDNFLPFDGNWFWDDTLVGVYEKTTGHYKVQVPTGPEEIQDGFGAISMECYLNWFRAQYERLKKDKGHSGHENVPTCSATDDLIEQREPVKEDQAEVDDQLSEEKPYFLGATGGLDKTTGVFDINTTDCNRAVDYLGFQRAPVMSALASTPVSRAPKSTQGSDNGERNNNVDVEKGNVENDVKLGTVHDYCDWSSSDDIDANFCRHRQ